MSTYSRLHFSLTETVEHEDRDLAGWLRLQIFGCDSPAGCIPGDLNLDGRVNLVDFAMFSVLFGGTATSFPPDCL